jgi:hypothetical protein
MGQLEDERRSNLPEQKKGKRQLGKNCKNRQKETQ